MQTAISNTCNAVHCNIVQTTIHLHCGVQDPLLQHLGRLGLFHKELATRCHGLPNFLDQMALKRKSKMRPGRPQLFTAICWLICLQGIASFACLASVLMLLCFALFCVASGCFAWHYFVLLCVVFFCFCFSVLLCFVVSGLAVLC